MSEAKPSSKATWIAVAGAAVVCGGVIALAFSGNADRRGVTPTDSTEVVAVHEEIAGAPRDLPALRPEALAPEALAPEAAMSLATASQSISIEMYTATWCQACQAAHRWMDAEHIAYHEIDVDRHHDAAAQLSVLNPRRTLPTFDIDGQVLVGFDQVALTSAIGVAARRHR